MVQFMQISKLKYVQKQRDGASSPDSNMGCRSSSLLLLPAAALLVAACLSAKPTASFQEIWLPPAKSTAAQDEAACQCTSSHRNTLPLCFLQIDVVYNKGAFEEGIHNELTRAASLNGLGIAVADSHR